MSNSLSRQLRTTLFYALRTAFRLTPMSQATRDRLRQRFLDTRGHWVPEGPKGKAPTGQLPRRPYVRSDERAIGYVPYEKGELPDPLPATLVAFYLPQFHTIPENDEWWGKGFTEWRNVTRALPQFEGHYQPKLPGDLGFYDLRNVEVMHEQARLAREYGISAFCFYFYWFGGKTLLETPLRNWLNDKSIDLKFCLCWANEKWTRTWDGRGDEILIDQKHSPEDDIAFIAHVAEYMRDPRYLRVDGKPMLVVYRPGTLPEMAVTARRWRTWCMENGIGELHIGYVQSFDQIDPRTVGLDSCIQFPPNLSQPSSITSLQVLVNGGYKGQVLDWREMARGFQNPDTTSYPRHYGVNCGWDNEARRSGKGRTYLHASPRRYRDWLRHAISSLSVHPSASERLVFINAWNEWAEGAALEPDQRLGYAWLSATRSALTPPVSRMTGHHAIIHAWYLEDVPELLGALSSTALSWHVVLTTSPEKREALAELVQGSELNIEIFTIENRGRDLLPFLKAADRLLDFGVDVVLKLHTKRSEHRDDGVQWRRELLKRLLTQDRASKTLDAFMRDETMGLVAPEGHLLPIEAHIGANKEGMEYLARRAGLPAHDAHDFFPAGSMFWVRLAALRPLLDAGLLASEFEAESGQIDGTLAHTVERSLGLCVREAGFRLTTVADLMKEGDVLPNRPGPYQYTSSR
ncbi:glycoside hydrolase family 99-like domain-containing protein [Pseudoxanthomonas sp. F11]|uniref:glycoside hydrolase family 99-like domain-containing protein n=1 Tax=Pseudoxanthomonas sp. F11 TaxID=3126308 RepID=UPI00300C5449